MQDTHLTENDLPLTKTIWNNDCYLHGKKTNARGAGILLNNNFECEILACNKDKEGNYLQLILKLTSFIVNLISIYAPNLDRPDFFMTLQTLIEGDIATDYNVICGDFNLVLDPKMDSDHYKNLNNPKAGQVVLNIINDYNLIDAFRTFHPDVKRYSWRKKNPMKQARLDYFLISDKMTDIFDNCMIRPSYRSDHSIVELDIIMNNFEIGKGIWKLNVNLLKNIDYINLINNLIDEEKHKYALPVYNPI